MPVPIDITAMPKPQNGWYRLEAQRNSFLISNIDIVQPMDCSTSIRCSRCSMQREVDITLYKCERWHCTSCGSSASCELIPSALHAGSSLFGYLALRNCSLTQIGTCTFRAFCSFCMGGSAVIKKVQAGRRAEASCMLCHKKMAIQMDQIPVTNIVGSTDGASGKCKKRSNDPKAQKPRIGARNAKVSIENQGACEHFKKSFRLLRFPCCGKAFPCPLCHALSGCQHTSRLATRQICGFCGHESPISDKPCVSCGKLMTGSKGANHWNAGRGNRNAATLSSKDKRKNKGVSRSGVKKTKSGKSHRVGAAGKRAREAAAAKRAKR